MAYMAVRSDPFKKIAECFHISLRMLNNNMQTIYGKLFITYKKELGNYVI